MAGYKKPTAWWRNLFSTGRLNASEDMVYSSDTHSMHRGKRCAARTEVCRPCLVWHPDFPDDKIHVVVLNLNRYGFLMRATLAFEYSTVLMLQMMRDEEFRFPLSSPIKTVVVRTATREDGFFDHGMRAIFEEVGAIMPKSARPAPVKAAATARRRPTRMYLIEGEQPKAKTDKNRRNRGY